MVAGSVTISRLPLSSVLREILAVGWDLKGWEKRLLGAEGRLSRLCYKKSMWDTGVCYDHLGKYSLPHSGQQVDSKCSINVRQSTPVLLPGKSHGRGSLEGCSPWGRWGSDTTEWLHFHFSLPCIGEENGNPLQCSCLENPRDRGACWAAVYGVAHSRTRLMQLSSRSSSSRIYTWDPKCWVIW